MVNNRHPLTMPELIIKSQQEVQAITIVLRNSTTLALKSLVPRLEELLQERYSTGGING